MDIGAGHVTVPVSHVVKIEEGRSALHEYQDRAAALGPGDAAGWVALGDWASARGLGTQAREAYTKGLALAPDDPRANAALGRTQIDGRWVSEEEGYRARGYVQHQGEWITPAELRGHHARGRGLRGAGAGAPGRRRARARGRGPRGRGRGPRPAGRGGAAAILGQQLPGLVRGRILGRGARGLADGKDQRPAAGNRGHPAREDALMRAGMPVVYGRPGGAPRRPRMRRRRRWTRSWPSTWPRGAAGRRLPP